MLHPLSCHVLACLKHVHFCLSMSILMAKINPPERLSKPVRCDKLSSIDGSCNTKLHGFKNSLS